MKKLFTALMLSASLFSSSVLLADMVNINKASAAAMQHNLKGVGEKKAEAIVAYREEHGAFKTLEEIKEVKGIGDGIFKKIKADLSLTEGVTELTGTAGAKGKPDDAVAEAAEN
jgi:competence protein ComEA